MKRLFLLISFAILHLFAFTQIDIQRDNRVSPVLKYAVTPNSGYFVYGRTGSPRFINMAVLNQSTHTVSWFTCHGRLFDSTKLTAPEYEQVISRQLDPFTLYQHICDSYLAEIAAARDIYRAYGDNQSFSRLNAGYRAVFAMESVQAAKTPLQKLIAIENVRKHILTQLAYWDCANPSALANAPLYTTNKEQAGIMVKTNDSTVYYNIDPTSAVTKIGLYKNSPEKLYVYNRQAQLIDSVSILPERYDLILKEKTDVFLLYRGWLEMQWQETMSALRRNTNNTGEYGEFYVKSESVVEKELYGQLKAIGKRIDQLIAPETKSIEQAVFETYKSQTSEINYIPLLGIGYNLVQKRGEKEYELNNHLGNVLATVSDKKNGVPSASNSTLIDHYEPDIVSAQDYYPFGMLQPGRSYLSPQGDRYRYGFNGKENDNEVKGEGSQLDYGMRVYDPRLGRFLSVDALQSKYPNITPYAGLGNNPINLIDPDGNEIDPVAIKNTEFWSTYQAFLTNPTAKSILTKFENNSNFNLTLKIGEFAATSTVDAHHFPTLHRVKNGNEVVQQNSTIEFNLKRAKIERFMTFNGVDYKYTRTMTDIYKFSTTLHELLHAKIAFDDSKKVDVEAAGDHNYFANKYYNTLLSGITEYAKANKLTNLSDQDLKELAFTGLEKSDLFIGYIKDLAQKHGTTYEQEKAAYDKRATAATWKTVGTRVSDNKVVVDGAESDKYNIQKQ
jgi:RHS repeat-associated protein